MKQLTIFFGVLVALVSVNLTAQTPVEVKLIAAIEEDRGWCLDLRGGQNNGAPIGGVHGHTCYTYNGRGPTNDQAFVQERIEENEFRMVAFPDMCMTIYEPRPGGFASIETCDGRVTQDIVLNEKGQIIPTMAPELCLTMDSLVLPGGGGNPLHIMRDISFEECDESLAILQTWELRAEWTGPEEMTAERPFAVKPAAPGGNN